MASWTKLHKIFQTLISIEQKTCLINNNNQCTPKFRNMKKRVLKASTKDPLLGYGIFYYTRWDKDSVLRNWKFEHGRKDPWARTSLEISPWNLGSTYKWTAPEFNDLRRGLQKKLKQSCLQEDAFFSRQKLNQRMISSILTFLREHVLKHIFR